MLGGNINPFQVHTTANRGRIKMFQLLFKGNVIAGDGIRLSTQANAQNTQGCICHVSLHTT